MYLKSIRVCNYRAHKETFVEFDRHLTLIGGPNESGKSTLVEAAHRVLFFKHRATGELQKEMMSLHSGEAPEVELQFCKQNTTYTIHKKFAAGRGTALLTSTDGLNLRNDEAEEKLGEILGLQSARYSSDLWSHLWVWQGTSTRNLLNQADNYRDDLLQKLQRLGAAGLIQSDLDSRLNAKILELYESIFNKNESFKVTAEAAQAEKQLKLCQETLDTKRARFEELKQLAEQYDSADQRLKDTASQIAKQVEALVKAREDFKTASETQQKRVEHEKELQEHQNALAEIESAQKNYHELQKRKRNAERKLNDLTPDHAAVDQAKRTAQSDYKTLTDHEEILNTRIRMTRLQGGISQATSQIESLQRDLERFEKTSSQVTKCKLDRKALDQSLATIPSLNKKNLQELGKLNTEIIKAETTLKAMSAAIRVAQSDTDVTLDGQLLTVDVDYPFTTLSELWVGQNTRLFITPGDGTTLHDAQRDLRQLKQRWQDMLDQLKVASLEDAQTFFDDRQHLIQQIEAIDNRLQQLDGDQAQLQYHEAQNQIERIARDKDHFSKELQPLLDDGQVRLDDLQTDETWQARLATLESEQRSLAENLKSARTRIERSTARLHELENAIKDCHREIQSISEQMENESRRLGDHEAREKKIVELKERIDEKSKALKLLEAELEELQPALMDRLIKRLENSLRQLEEQKETAIASRAGALSKLQSDGSVDIYAELAAAESAYQYAQIQFSLHQCEALAIKLLKELFEREQKKLTDTLTEPFVQRMKKYVQCFTGEVSKISFEVTNKGFSELRIARPSDNHSPVDFEQLSGGAREQIAAAARLAVAEVLASDSEDGLPIVFDDAFSYSDSRRLEALPMMMEHAIDAGLQLIIVTCNPLHYAALGATTVQISRN